MPTYMYMYEYNKYICKHIHKYVGMWVCAHVCIYKENYSVSVYTTGRETTAFSPNQAHYLFLQTKLYWNTAMSMCLFIIFGCYCATMA